MKHITMQFSIQKFKKKFGSANQKGQREKEKDHFEDGQIQQKTRDEKLKFVCTRPCQAGRSICTGFLPKQSGYGLQGKERIISNLMERIIHLATKTPCKSCFSADGTA